MRWTLLFIPLFIIGCSVDELPPCEGVGMEGEICKEYQYVFGSYNGVNEYEYDLGTNLLSKVTTKRKNGSTEGVTKYGYNADGLITSIVLEDSKGKVLSEKTTTYNSDQNVLLETLIGQTNSQTESNYEGSLLKAVSYKNEGVIEWVDSLEYYSGTNDLYRKLRFREGVLSEI